MAAQPIRRQGPPGEAGPRRLKAGIYFPTEEMSSTMRQIGNFTPLGSALHAVRDSWMGLDPRPDAAAGRSAGGPAGDRVRCG
jgi:hypothetical protein